MATTESADEDGLKEGNNSLTENGEFTFFNRLAGEEEEEKVQPSPSTGMLSNLLGRFWKSESPNPSSPNLSALAASPSTSSAADAPLPSDAPIFYSGAAVGGDDEPDPLSIESLREAQPLAPLAVSEQRHPSIASQRLGNVPSPSTTSTSSQDDAQRKFSDKLTNMFKGRKAGLQEYNHKQFWMPDATGKECYQCEERFTAFRRRHHCRLCGQIFCSKCCNIHVPGAALGYNGDLRLCSYCAKMMAQYIPEEAENPTSDDVPVGLANPSSSSNGRKISSVSSTHARGTPGVLSTSPTGNGIATVSKGSMIWSRDGMAGGVTTSTPERKNSLSFPAAATTGPQSAAMPKPPSLLSVQDLYLQHEKQDPKRTRSSSSVGGMLAEEDESGPDWFRSMQPTTASLKEDLKPSVSGALLCDTSTSTFDPLPIKGTSRGVSPIPHDEVQKEAVARQSSLGSKPQAIDDDDIDAAFDRKLVQVLDYLCNRERVDSEKWAQLILLTARAVATTVRVDVARGKDSMNILDYVHVKKLAVNCEKPSAEIVWGVVCSKTVIHQELANELPNASVMIVAGSIEYERNPGKISNIQPIIAQEDEFLSKQADKILSRRPSVLLVEGTVARKASNLLRDAGVRVVINLKPKVLQRIARGTGADILPSCDAQLIQQNIGFCPLFKQIAVPLLRGGMKHLLVFDQCASDRGCSVLLRSNDLRELKAVKRIVLYMISLIYSMNLEKSFLNLFGIRLAYQYSNCDVCEQRRIVIEKEEIQENSAFEKALESAVLTASPYIDYETPYLETAKGRQCPLLPYFKQPLYRFGVESDFERLKDDESADYERKIQMATRAPVPPEPRAIFSSQTNVAASESSSDALTAFRAFGGRLFRKRLEARPKQPQNERSRHQSRELLRRNDVLDPYVHRRIAVLFGSFSPKSPNAPFFCVRPWVVSMEYYADHDMPLGEFLTKYCFNKQYECPSTNCEVPMLDHSRKLVYGRVCVEVTTQPILHTNGADDAANSGQILTWHHCPTCKATSPVVPLTFEAWHLSFGVYLDYLGNSGFSKGAATSPSAQPCSHCFFHQQTHFFSLNNYVATFSVTPIRPFNVQFSPILCNIVPQQFKQQDLIEHITRIASLADDIIRTADDRLKLYMRHEKYSADSSVSEALQKLLEGAQATVNERRQYVEQIKMIHRITVPSNDIFAVKGNEAVMYIREAIYYVISTWNSTVRSVKKSVEDPTIAPTDIPENCLDPIDDPFPSYLHLGLRLHPRAGVVVRDIQDSRGAYKPDIGSIIAYALSAMDYSEQRKKQYEAGGEETVLNLNSNSVGSNEASQEAEHYEMDFQDGQAKYYVKTYYAERFRLLRKLLFVEGEEAFIRSLSQSYIWTPQGGKSGSFFYRTQDDRFVVKQMSRFEVQSFVKFAPNYFEYIKTAVTENKLTTLCKVYGVFRVGVKGKNTQLKVDILVMEYLFYKHNVNQIWDLKGSLRNRLASTGKSSSDDLVLLDENFMKDLWNKQLYVYPHSKAALNQAISNDSHFLSAQHVMDYSLLVGVDETNGELILGIVDYMRTYTLDKKLESWVKIVAIPGAHLPTILSPEMYCTRFSEAIDTYFPVVPDQWTGLGSAVSY